MKKGTLREHSIHYNFIMNFILSASSIIFPLITVPYVSRILLPEGTGKVAWAISIVTYFTMIAMLGIPTYGIKAVARVRNDPEKLAQTTAELLSINVIMAAISYAAFLAALFFIPRLAQQKELMLICSSAIWLNALGVNWFYQGMEQYGYIATASLLMKVLALVLMFAMIHTRQDTLWYGLTSTLSSFGSYAINFIRLPFYVSFKTVRKLSMALHWRAILTFFAMSVATTVYTNLDTVMLGFIKGDYQTGLYNEAIKIKVLLTTLITSLGAVLLPRMSAYYKEGKTGEFNRLLSKASSFVLLCALPLCAFFMAFAPQVLWILSGTAYLPAAPIMQVLMPTVLLIGLSNLSGIEVLVPMDQEKKVLVSVGAGAVFNLVFNALLIPMLGALGAAISTLCAEGLVLAIQLVYLRKILVQVLPAIEWRIAAISFAASLPFLALSLCTPWLGNWISFIAGGLLYFGFYAFWLWKLREPIFMDVLQKGLKLLKRA